KNEALVSLRHSLEVRKSYLVALALLKKLCVPPRSSGGSMAGGLFSRILVPVDFSPCSIEAFRTAVSLAELMKADVLFLHVIDTSALDALNRLGLLAVPSDTAAQKKRLRHHARLNAGRLLESEQAPGVTVRRMILEGAPFVEIAKTTRAE